MFWVYVCACVRAVEAVLRRLLFQFKYMPTRAVLKQRLGATEVKHSKALQGTIIWLLINQNMRFLTNFRSLIKVNPWSTIYPRYTCENQRSMNPQTIIQKMMRSDVKAQYQSPWNESLTNISFWLTGILTVLNFMTWFLDWCQQRQAFYILVRRIFLKAILSDSKPLKKRWPEDALHLKWRQCTSWPKT